jgi:hypothetical protein
LAPSLIQRFAIGFVPDEDNNEPGNCTTQVSEMSHIITGGISDCQRKFEGAIDDHEPFGFDGEQEIDIDKRIGKQVTKSSKTSKDGSRRSYGCNINFEIG